MKNNTIINGAEIQNLITKFYYKNNHLCFQILLYLGVEKTVPYREFTDYSEYKKVYNHLMNVKSTNSQIEISSSELSLSNMGMA